MTIKIIVRIVLFIVATFSGGATIGARLSGPIVPEAVIVNTPQTVNVTFGNTSLNPESDVLTNPMPETGVLCEDVSVRSAPLETGIILYTLQSGTEVPFRELGRGHSTGWLMIYRAEWIPMSALCKR